MSIQGETPKGYDNIDARIVWGVIEEDLDKLLEDVGKLIEETDQTL